MRGRSRIKGVIDRESNLSSSSRSKSFVPKDGHDERESEISSIARYDFLEVLLIPLLARGFPRKVERGSFTGSRTSSLSLKSRTYIDLGVRFTKIVGGYPTTRPRCSFGP